MEDQVYQICQVYLVFQIYQVYWIHLVWYTKYIKYTWQFIQTFQELKHHASEWNKVVIKQIKICWFRNNKTNDKNINYLSILHGFDFQPVWYVQEGNPIHLKYLVAKLQLVILVIISLWIFAPRNWRQMVEKKLEDCSFF